MFPPEIVRCIFRFLPVMTSQRVRLLSDIREVSNKKKALLEVERLYLLHYGSSAWYGNLPSFYDWLYYDLCDYFPGELHSVHEKKGIGSNILVRECGKYLSYKDLCEFTDIMEAKLCSLRDEFY